MKKTFFILIILLTLFLTVSSVCASENVTGDSQSSPADDLKEKVNINDGNQVLSGDNTNSLNQILKEKASGGNSTPPVVKSKSKISASKVKGYESFNTKFVVKLKINGKVAPAKKVTIKLNKKTYTRQTNAKGQAILNTKLPKGNYKVNFAYAGDANSTSSSGSSKIIIKNVKKTHFVTDKYINFRHGLKSLFYVKLVDEKGKPLKAKIVMIKVKGKYHKVKTTKKGYARLHLSLKKGTYRIKCIFSKKLPYLSCKKTLKIKVRSKMPKGNGYWMWPMHMYSTSLYNLAKKGTKHIFLLGDAVSAYGKNYVTSWIKRAHSYGMKVHLWILVCYDGDWSYPVKKDGKFRMDFIKHKIREAKYYARIKGVDGIHLDYMRFGGTAHKYANSVKSINYVVKKISYAVHKIKPNIMVSIAIMPEPGSMKYYYGQSVPVLSRYVDALLPMAYKGSYGKSAGWIKSVTKAFVKQSSGAQIWTGLQTYKSENDASVIPYAQLMKDARYAMKGGAKGVVLFRIGITHYLNFRRV